VTTKAFARGLSTQQKQVEKIMEEYRDTFASPTMMPLHCWVKHSIDLIPDARLPNGPIYECFLLENAKIKCQI
jgi:hypothetical protein